MLLRYWLLANQIMRKYQLNINGKWKCTVWLYFIIQSQFRKVEDHFCLNWTNIINTKKERFIILLHFPHDCLWNRFQNPIKKEKLSSLMAGFLFLTKNCLRSRSFANHYISTFTRGGKLIESVFTTFLLHMRNHSFSINKDGVMMIVIPQTCTRCVLDILLLFRYL